MADPEGALAYDAKQRAVAAAMRRAREEGRVVDIDAAGNVINWQGQFVSLSAVDRCEAARQKKIFRRKKILRGFYLGECVSR